jgi:hypothetical protein
MVARTITAESGFIARALPRSGSRVPAGLAARWRHLGPRVKTAAKVGACVALGPIAVGWIAYGAWLTARDIDACSE